MTYDLLFYAHAFIYQRTILFLFFDACVDIILWAAPVIISSFMRRFSSVFPGQKREYLESKVLFQWREKMGIQKGKYKRC